MRGNATVVRLRAAVDGTDRYSNEVKGEPARLMIAGAGVAPRTSSDIGGDGRTGVIVGLTLLAPFGTDIVHADQFEVDGVLYEIDGDAGSWESALTGWEAGVEVALKRVVG